MKLRLKRDSEVGYDERGEARRVSSFFLLELFALIGL